MGLMRRTLARDLCVSRGWLMEALNVEIISLGEGEDLCKVFELRVSRSGQVPERAVIDIMNCVEITRGKPESPRHHGVFGGSETGVSGKSEEKGCQESLCGERGQGIGISLSLQLQTPPSVTGRPPTQRERCLGEKDGIMI